MPQSKENARRIIRPVRDRFNERIRVTPGCWYWLGEKWPKGYGRMNIFANGMWRGAQAHRLSYEMHVGPIPEGMCVCHQCDTPGCVNPDHLWLGTNQQNVDDKMSKGRWAGNPATGQDHALSKLSDEDVYSIRADARPITTLAREFGVMPTTVISIKKRRRWSHLPSRGDERESVDGRLTNILPLDVQEAIRADARSNKAIASSLGISAATVNKVRLGRGCYAARKT